jgi:hypothetical protein
MPVYTITAPDGKEYDVTAPEGATQEQVLAYAKANYSGAATPAAAPAAAPEAPSMLSQLGRQAGLTARGAITGAAAIPTMVGNAANALINQATGTQLKPSSQGLQELLTRLGLPEPQGGVEQAVQAGVGAMAGTGAMGAVAKGVPALTENIGKQIVSSGAAGTAAQPVAEAVTERTESPLAGIIAGMATGAVVGSATGKGVDSATKAMAQRGQAPVTLADVKQGAQRAYTEMEQQGVALKPLSVMGMVNDIRDSLKKANFIPEDPGTARINALVNNYDKMLETGARVPFTTLESMRSQAVNLKASNESDVRRLAGVIVNSIDNKLANLTGKDVMTNKGNLDTAVSSVMQAREQWRTMSKATILEDVLNIAETKALKPQASESEIIRDNLIRLMNNKAAMRNFSEVEQNAIKSVAKGGAADPLLSLAAKFNPQRSQLVAGASLPTMLVSPVAGVGVPLAGFTADKLQNYLRTSRTKGLISDILRNDVQPQPDNMAWRGAISGIPQ